MSGRLPVALGFRAQRGGSVVLAVGIDGGEPRVALNGFLATAAEGDRLAFEPYHVAYETTRVITPEVAAEVAEGRRRQEIEAAKNLAAVIDQLRSDGFEPAVTALLANRAGWMTDLLAHALSAPEHPAVMEGLAVREALRSALRGAGLAITEMDEKTLPDTAAAVLDRSPAEVDSALKVLGAAAGKPWRKEQKLAALAAWVAATAP